MVWWNHQGLTASCFLIHHSPGMAPVFTSQMVGRTLVIIPVFQTRGGRLVYFRNPLLLRVGWTQWLLMNRNSKSDVMSLLRLGYKKTVASLSPLFSLSIPPSPFFSLPHTLPLEADSPAPVAPWDNHSPGQQLKGQPHEQPRAGGILQPGTQDSWLAETLVEEMVFVFSC